MKICYIYLRKVPSLRTFPGYGLLCPVIQFSYLLLGFFCRIELGYRAWHGRNTVKKTFI